MLAKGRLLGVQFEAMLENGDYTRLAARANDLAQELKRAFVDHGLRSVERYGRQPDFSHSAR